MDRTQLVQYTLHAAWPDSARDTYQVGQILTLFSVALVSLFAVVCLRRVKVDDKAIRAADAEVVRFFQTSSTRSARSQWSLHYWHMTREVTTWRRVAPLPQYIVGNRMGKPLVSRCIMVCGDTMLTCRWNWDQTAHGVLAHELTTLFKLDDGISEASLGG